MVNKPIGYDKWRERCGETCELGSQMLLTDMLLAKANIPEVLKKAGDMLGATFARALFSAYKLTADFSLELEWDVSLRSWENTIVMPTEFTDNPVQYCYYAWEGWNDEWVQRMNWEEKSLWGYIKHWVMRKLGRIRTERWLDGKR